jgi:hypothetical protein
MDCREFIVQSPAAAGEIFVSTTASRKETG